eukprot:3038140-Amphidinium_carterae.1
MGRISFESFWSCVRLVTPLDYLLLRKQVTQRGFVEENGPSSGKTPKALTKLNRKQTSWVLHGSCRRRPTCP